MATKTTATDPLTAARSVRDHAKRAYYRAIERFGFGGYETVPASNRLRAAHAAVEQLLADADIREITGAEPTDLDRAAFAEMLAELRAEELEGGAK